MRDENVRAWHEVEHDFLECEYRAVRDRQMKELELEDDLLSKVPVRYAICRFVDKIQIADNLMHRNLKKKLYKESFEFVRQQRIQCLLQGAWFMNGIPLATTVPRDTLKRPTRPWRFLRLVCGCRRYPSHSLR